MPQGGGMNGRSEGGAAERRLHALALGRRGAAVYGTCPDGALRDGGARPAVGARFDGGARLGDEVRLGTGARPDDGMRAVAAVRANDAPAHPGGSGRGAARRATARSLSGVRGGDAEAPAAVPAMAGAGATAGGAMAAASRRRVPRWSFRPVHALAAVLLLACALCASLTMLVQQSLNYAALDGASALSTAGSGAGESRDQVDADAADGDMSGPGGGEDAGEAADAGAASTPPEGSGTPATQDAPPGGEPSADGNAGGDSPARGAVGADAAAGRTATAPIDLNTAGLAELDAITGVGPVIAGRIIEHRAAIGRFTSVDQLLDVSGIGPKTLERMRPQVVVR